MKKRSPSRTGDRIQPSTRERSTTAKAQRLARRRATARDDIVAAATETLLRTGVAGFTLQAVARDLGITKQGLYYHFASKEELVLAVCLQEWTEVANAMHQATKTQTHAADALEALIRTYVLRYLKRPQLFKLITQEVNLSSAAQHMTQEDLSAFRPLNDLAYGPTEALLKAELDRDQRCGPFHPRRLAFVAHTAAMGLLAMKTLVESANDPLKHRDADLLDELCQVFRRGVG